MQNRYTFATREVDLSWIYTVTAIVNPRGKRVIDVSCGGRGIYSYARAQFGAVKVIGIDFSAQMVQAAMEHLRSVANLRFQRGDASATGLGNGCAYIVFARALLHHIADLSACLNEAYWLLARRGVYTIQDRTPAGQIFRGRRSRQPWWPPLRRSCGSILVQEAARNLVTRPKPFYTSAGSRDLVYT
jgi:ubiquinone/menaquinone biosynthesis C-methylase UbiE